MEDNKYPQITSESIQSYCDKYSSKVSSSLQLLEELSKSAGNIKMLSGGYLGQFLALISIIIQPKIILEIGTFTGYGTLCLARGLGEDGRILTIEKNKDLESFYSKSSEAHLLSKITQLMGDASEIIAELDFVFDLVFIDAAKRQYINYYELVLPKLKQGGVILADNVLWKGKVVTEDNDKLGQGLDEFNKHVYQDSRVENIILPIDDGLHLIIKK